MTSREEGQHVRPRENDLVGKSKIAYELTRRSQ